MKKLLFLLSFCCVAAALHAQVMPMYGDTFVYKTRSGAQLMWLFKDGKLQFPGYGNTDSTYFWSTDSAGNVVLRKIISGNPASITTETDPTIADFIKAITAIQIANWDSAYNNSHTHSNKTALDKVSGINTGDQDLTGLQPKLVSGENLKTINNQSLLGPGDITVSGSAGSLDTSKLSLDTLNARHIAAITTQKDTAVWFGTSITAGSNAIPLATNRFSAVASGILGLNEKNKGVPGMTLIGSSGNSFLVNVRAGVIRQSYNSQTRYVFFEFGTNDFDATDTIAYDTTKFITAYNEVLDSCVATGIPLAKIKILTPCYNTSVNQWRIGNYITAIKNFGLTRGVQVIDQYTTTADLAAKVSFFTIDVIHPNTYGHWFMALNIAKNLPGGVSLYNPGATILDGLTQMNNRLYMRGGFQSSSNTLYAKPVSTINDTITATRPNDVLEDVVINPYFRDSSFTNIDHIGLRIKNAYLAMGNAIHQSNSTEGDILFQSGLGIASGFSNNYEYRFIPYTSSGNAEYRMYGGGQHLFYTNGGITGNQLLALKIWSSGDITVAGAVNMGGRLVMPGAGVTTKAGTSDILMNQNAGITGAATGLTAANYVNRFIVQATGGVMEFRTYRPQGKFDWYVTNGVDSAQILSMRLQENGNLLIGPNATTNYGTNMRLQIYGSAYFRDSVKVGKLPAGNTNMSIAMYNNLDSNLYQIPVSALGIGSGGTTATTDSSTFATNYRVDTAKANLRASIAAIAANSGTGGTTTTTSTNVQVFTSSGTWTMPAGAKSVYVYLQAGGGGGGSGRKGAATTIRCGGGGAGAGGISIYTFDASQLSSTVSVTVGAGGAGGAAVTANSTNGNNGAIGGTSAFGTYLKAAAGNAGSGGTASSGTAGSAGSGISFNGGSGGTASTTGTNGGNGNQSTTMGSGGGGAGSGISAADGASSGGAGGTQPLYYNGTISGGTAGSAGASGGAGNNSGYLGTGGGGGASSLSTNAGNGGAGALYGAGGGGGGAAVDNVGNSGSGGNGANGVVVVITYF